MKIIEQILEIIQQTLSWFKSDKLIEEKTDVDRAIKISKFTIEDPVYNRIINDSFKEDHFFKTKKFKAPIFHIRKMKNAMEKLNGSIIWNDFKLAYHFLHFSEKQIKIKISKIERRADHVITLFSFGLFLLGITSVILLVPEIENPKTFLRMFVSLASSFIMGYLLYMTALSIKKAKKLEKLL